MLNNTRQGKKKSNRNVVHSSGNNSGPIWPMCRTTASVFIHIERSMQGETTDHVIRLNPAARNHAAIVN
jgi:hypothetical protein